MFVSPQNFPAAVLSPSLGQCFERFENQLTGSEFHVAAHLIEIELRVDERAVEIEDYTAYWHVTWPRSPGPAGAEPARRRTGPSAARCVLGAFRGSARTTPPEAG